MFTRSNRPLHTAVLLCVAILTWIATAGAQVGNDQLPPAGTAWQFDITGFIQEATFTGSGTFGGGTITVNGHVVTVPANTIVILPANALTWQELFAQAPAPYAALGQTGLALSDGSSTVPPPLTTYEAHVVGNVVPNGTPGQGTYIAGLVYISQQDLNAGAGYITAIDYVKGELLVQNPGGASVRVRINDPSGRFGRINTPDARFTVDADNPTIASATGFPMCLPRFDPASTADPDCPQGNRPLSLTGGYASSFQMPDPATLAAGQLPDPRTQAPFEIGDYITFAGTLVQDCDMTGCPGGGPTAGPFPAKASGGAGATYISAHTIGDNFAIYTWPNTNPAYVSIEVTLIGTGGLTVLGAGEAAARTRFEGMTTDPSRIIHLYGIDLDPTTGNTADRDWGMIGVDPGPPAGAVKGRWRFRPPCTVTIPTQKECTPPPGGTYLPPTREVRAVLEKTPGSTQQSAWVAGQTTAYANGIIAGQYHAPILEYIFPENIPGAPPPPNNFMTMPFLAQGGYSSSTGAVAKGPLDPWPGAVAPPSSCTPANALAGGPYTVASTGTITLAGVVSGTAPVSISWGVPAVGTLSATNILNPVYTAPSVTVPTTVNLTLTAVNCTGFTSVSTTTVTINSAAAPTVNHIAPVTVFSGTTVTITATGTDPGGLPLSFTWTQTGGTPSVLFTNPSVGATVSFTVFLPLGAPGVTLDFMIVATNSAGVSSAPEFTSVTVNPLPDVITITSAEYRTGKRRLSITATSSVTSPSVVLTLQPYLTTTGELYDPALLGAVFTNNGGGLYTLDLVGPPEPAVPPATPLTVKSNLGGVSAPSALTRIRN